VRAVQGSCWHRTSSALRFELLARRCSLVYGEGPAPPLEKDRIPSSRPSPSSHPPYLWPFRVTVPILETR
jgi:hypothetical protein